MAIVRRVIVEYAEVHPDQVLKVHLKLTLVEDQTVLKTNTESVTVNWTDPINDIVANINTTITPCVLSEYQNLTWLINKLN